MNLIGESPLQSNLTLLVNAGGLSRRMGQNKALLPVGDGVLITAIVQRLRPLAQAGVIVVANDPAVIQALAQEPRVQVAGDRWPQGGALGGLATGLALASGWTLAVACDMPFVDAGLAGYMAALAADEWDVVAPESETHVQVFHALYHPRCLPAFEASLRAGRLAVMAAFDQLRVRWVRGDELAAHQTVSDAFVNVNTPEEWAAAQARLAELKTGR